MEKKRELLAKALMDASKVLLITIYAKNFLDPCSGDLLATLGNYFVIMGTGCLAWFIQPK